MNIDDVYIYRRTDHAVFFRHKTYRSVEYVMYERHGGKVAFKRRVSRPNGRGVRQSDEITKKLVLAAFPHWIPK